MCRPGGIFQHYFLCLQIKLFFITPVDLHVNVPLLLHFLKKTGENKGILTKKIRGKHILFIPKSGKTYHF